MSTLDLSTVSFMILPQLLRVKGATYHIPFVNCNSDKHYDTVGVLVVKTKLCSKSYKNNNENEIMDRSISGVFRQNGSTLMSYHDYHTRVDRITSRLHNIIQENSKWVSMKCDNWYGLIEIRFAQ